MTKLSILICTLPERYEKLSRLNSQLDPQIEKYNGQVEKRIDDRPRYVPTGTKRNNLLDCSDGEFHLFLDDDDLVSDDYVDQIMKAIESNPDVVTFNGWVFTKNGRTPWDMRLGNEYVDRGGVHYRFPNHLTAMKRECVKSVRFRDIWIQEDYYFAKTINDRRLLKTSVHIEKPIYFYYPSK